MKILFGVFDWGMGHATRSIPLIEGLLGKKHRVDIVSTARAMNVLKDHFKKRCRYFDVPSVSQPSTKTKYMSLAFAFNSLKNSKELKISRRKIEEIISKEKYDIVINDCRPDVYDKKENSFLINHQLHYKVKFFQFVVDRAFNKFMKKFAIVFVPDFPPGKLTGMLSNNPKFKGRVEFIGILSHVKKKKLDKDIDYFISLSGLEPQRTLLEEKILSQIERLSGKVVVTLGKPELKSIKTLRNVKIYSSLNSKDQEEMLNHAKFVIARTGYTTVMDLLELGKKKVLFIPTPGQTEQEYLSNCFEKGGYFHHVNQKKLNFSKDIEDAKKFNGFDIPWKTEESVKKFMKIVGV